MRKSIGTQAVLAAVLAAIAAAMPAGPVAIAADDSPLAAVWKEQSVDFLYFGRTSRYTCDGIRDKLRAILGALGARRDIHALAVGCAESGDSPRELLHEMSPTVHLVFSAAALPDASAKAAHPGDLAPVAARYQPFSITTDAFRNMQLGDCELVEEFVRQVLPKLVTRNVEKNITCVPYQLSGSQYTVRGEVLKP